MKTATQPSKKVNNSVTARIKRARSAKGLAALVPDIKSTATNPKTIRRNRRALIAKMEQMGVTNIIPVLRGRAEPKLGAN